MHRSSVGKLGIAVLLAVSVVGCGPGRSDRSFMSIGTGGTGGVYYVLGGALANRMSLRDSTRQYTAEVTGASVENVNRIRSGELGLGFAMALTVYQAYNGGPDYPQPFTGLRVVAPLYPNMTHIMVARGSDIRSVADLRGKRVSVGSAGSGTEEMSRQLLDAAGMGYDDIDARYLSFSESASAIQDGAIDAAILSVGYPASAVLQATTTADARLIPVGDDLFRALKKKHPYYSRSSIPAGVYKGVTDPVPTVSMMNWIVARDDLPASVVDVLLDVLSGDRDALIQVHEMARQIDLGNLRNAPIPVHPAATKWLAAHSGSAEGGSNTGGRKTASAGRPAPSS